jgi:parallel beta-helix repeat protein
MTTYYVSSGIGNDDNAGTSAAAPFATLQVAANHTAPGDTVLVMNGTYTGGAGGVVANITHSGTASAPITFQAAPGQTPIIDSSDCWHGILISASYIVVDGFTVVGNAATITLQDALAHSGPGNPHYDGNGISADTSSAALPHNITIQNNTIYNEPGGGIVTIGADYVQILNNTVHDNAHWSAYGASGVSVGASANVDMQPGAHFLISGNTVYNNSELVPEYRANAITDGEGIILDSNSGYTGEMLVQNNTVYGNGGPGIEAFRTDNAVITGNTIYGNNTRNVQAPSNSQIFINQSNNVTVTNNNTGAPPVDTPPTVSVSDTTATHGQVLAASSLFSASDADGDTLTQFDFWNTGTGGGHFVLNGVAQGTNQSIVVSASQLAQLSYQSGSGADTLWVRANDGTQWSSWSNSFTVTAPVDSGPVETVSNVTLTKGQSSIAASNLFSSATDPDGDSIVSYRFWDTGAGGGHFLLNGVAQPTNQSIVVSASQLSQLTYHAGSSADTVWISANDGFVWGPWSQAFTVSPFVDTPPTMSVSDTTATHGQVLAASSLFSASDADGDTLTQFDFWNTGTGGGHFVLNGVGQGTNQSIVVSASQLAQLSYQSGSGADTLWVRANDGTQWSSWSSSFTVTAPVDTGPVVTPTNFSISSFANQSFAASSLFTYSDPFGSPATQYDVWDTGDGGGHFALNGIPLPANQDNIVSAAQLGQLTYQVGTGTDTLWVKANDGTAWGDWSKSFTISDPPAVEAGKTITLGSAYAGAANFLSDTGTLKLEDPSSFAGTVAGLHGQDAVDLADIAFGVNTTLGYSANSGNTGDTLTVSDGTHATRLALLGQYAASSFVMASDGHGGTLISDPAPSQQSLLTLPHA